MDVEYAALVKNATWTLCPGPTDHYIIDTKRVYKTKQNEDGCLDHRKARLVAKGFNQISGLDFSQTFSLVIKLVIVRVVLTLVVHFGWDIKQLDVSNAFLYETLDEEVYTSQPQGYVDPHHPDYVCRLNKALHGLKQAHCAWFNRFSQYLPDLGFQDSSADQSLFTYHNVDIHIFLLVHVDEILIM